MLKRCLQKASRVAQTTDGPRVEITGIIKQKRCSVLKTYHLTS